MKRKTPLRCASIIRLCSRSAFCCLMVACFASLSQAGVRKNVLMISEMGHSHPGPEVVTKAIVSALQSDRQFEEEFHWENLDAADISEDARNRLRDLIVEKYRHHKFDVILLLGPDPLRLMSDPSRPFYPNVPVVFCCAVPGEVDPGTIDSRSTGSWFQLDPSKTLDAALQLLPDTRHVFVIAGQSNYDRGLTRLVKAGLNSYPTRLDIAYLTDLSMNELQERLKHLPSRSIVLYVSLFKDAQQRELLNDTEALPLVVAASNAPVFGLSDTYLGRGVVGGFVVSFEEQGKIAARDALEILAGTAPKDIPVVYGPGVYQFDWRELQRWKLDQSKLPAGSVIRFQPPTFWQRQKWIVLTGLLILVGLGLLIIVLLTRKKVKAAEKAQEQLSGMLINAQEVERRRLASEIHDDFSQRLAILALGLGNAAERVQREPAEVSRKLEDLSGEVNSLGADLHTLSHRLHSAVLGSLGLVSSVNAYCKEFSSQQDIRTEFIHDDIPREIDPEVALCVFRIVQESLRNVKKHSGTSTAKVSMQAVEGTIHLRVSDQGVGFDPKKINKREGLGTRSMAERAHILGGHLEIRSKPGKGTIIDVRVPLRPKSSSAA